MATHPIQPISPANDFDENDYRTLDIAAGETFLSGAALTLSGGQLAEAGTDPATIVGFSTAGVSDYSWMADTRGTVVPKVPVATPEKVFRGNLSTAASGTPTTIADVSAEIGVQYGIVLDAASGYWVIDHSDTTNKRVTIVGIDDAVADGDGNILVNFTVIPSVWELLA